MKMRLTKNEIKSLLERGQKNRLDNIIAHFRIILDCLI